jgi:hypothetical protein
METCEECGRGIGEQETPHLHRDRVVCGECNARLMRAKSPKGSPIGFRPSVGVPTFAAALALLSLIAYLGAVLPLQRKANRLESELATLQRELRPDPPIVAAPVAPAAMVASTTLPMQVADSKPAGPPSWEYASLDFTVIGIHESIGFRCKEIDFEQRDELGHGDTVAQMEKLYKAVGGKDRPIDKSSYVWLDIFNAAGSAGWELISHAKSKDDSISDEEWVFKRPMKPAP